MFIAVTNTVRKKGRLLCHVAERTFTNGKMAGGRVAIFVAGHLPARRNMGMFIKKRAERAAKAEWAAKKKAEAEAKALTLAETSAEAALDTISAAINPSQAETV